MIAELASTGEMRGPGAQARAWIVRLKSGVATRDDLTAFAAWRRSDSAHEAAWRETLETWQLIGSAAAAAAPAHSVMPSRAAMISRRGVLAGGGAVAAGVIALPVALSLTSLPAGATVIETRKGERRRAALTTGIAVELNTDSRLVSWTDEGGPRLRLDRGEVLVSVDRASRRLRASAGGTEIFAEQARFLLRWIGDAAPSVVCVSGLIAVHADGRSFRVAANETISDGAKLPLATDAQAASGVLEWRKGVLAFEGRPAGEVIAELNRYREGRVFLPGSHAQVRISGVIHLDRADAAVDHIARSLDMKVTRLPGGLAILRS